MGVRAVVSCGSGVVVVGERVADAAQRVAGVERDVVGDAADLADQGEQFGPGARVLGRWDAVGLPRLRAGHRYSLDGRAGFRYAKSADEWRQRRRTERPVHRTGRRAAEVLPEPVRAEASEVTSSRTWPLKSVRRAC